MANNKQTGTSPFNITVADAYIIGGDSSGQASLLLVQLTSSAFSGTITVKARKAGTSLTPLAIPYKSRYLNGAVSTDANLTTGITGSSVIEVDAAGLDIVLDTAYTAGTMICDYSWVIG